MKAKRNIQVMMILVLGTLALLASTAAAAGWVDSEKPVQCSDPNSYAE